ncbi:hypothetical protein HanHA300_Chr01g0005691 [Helianthus annuus]|nr:hypothetical protein HanHA300_Chr01g0005691 [Helianthus annuus]
MSIAKKGFQQYLLQLQEHPLRTKALTAGTLAAISDVVSQKLSGIQKLQIRRLLLKVALTAGTLAAISDVVSQKLSGIQKLQIRRLLLKVLFGCAYLGPFGHFYHTLLDKLFKGKKDNATVVKKVVVDQLTASPWNNLMFMLYYGFVIEGRQWIHVKSKIKKEYPSVQYASWTFLARNRVDKTTATCRCNSVSLSKALLQCAGVYS